MHFNILQIFITRLPFQFKANMFSDTNVRGLKDRLGSYLIVAFIRLRLQIRTSGWNSRVPRNTIRHYIIANERSHKSSFFPRPKPAGEECFARSRRANRALTDANVIRRLANAPDYLRHSFSRVARLLNTTITAIKTQPCFPAACWITRNSKHKFSCAIHGEIYRAAVSSEGSLKIFPYNASSSVAHRWSTRGSWRRQGWSWRLVEQDGSWCARALIALSTYPPAPSVYLFLSFSRFHGSTAPVIHFAPATLKRHRRPFRSRPSTFTNAGPLSGPASRVCLT